VRAGAKGGLRWLKGLPLAAPARHEQEDVLKQAFLPFGNVENIKLIKEKGGGFGHLVRCDSRVSLQQQQAPAEPAAAQVLVLTCDFQAFWPAAGSQQRPCAHIRSIAGGTLVSCCTHSPSRSCLAAMQRPPCGRNLY
jgi:hypothetical protein